ncbi:MAG: DUF4410 domain-containing protein [Verrucomicrobiota bacterium]
MRVRGTSIFGLGVVFLFIGCASISVRQIEEAENYRPKKAPDIIYVAPFEVEKTEFNVDREGDELVQFKKSTALVLQEALVERIGKALGSAEALGSKQKLPKHGWIVIGKFVKVNQGSRALRAIVGFGAGGTKMETEVFVYDLAQKPPVPFLAFKTSGGSNAEPGFLIDSTNPLSLATGVLGSLGGLAKGITDDSLRTSRMITAQISQFLLKQKWINPEQATEPKMDGEIGPLLPR